MGGGTEATSSSVVLGDKKKLQSQNRQLSLSGKEYRLIEEHIRNFCCKFLKDFEIDLKNIVYHLD